MEAQRYEQTEVRYQQFDALIGAGQAELRIVNDALGRIGKPEGVVEAVWALAALGLVGIVWPLTALAVRPVPSGWVFRLATVVTFAIGLALVIGFMLDLVRSLDRDRAPAASSVGQIVMRILFDSGVEQQGSSPGS